MPIAKNVLDIRDRLNLSQQELAEKTGVTQTFISNIEKGFKVPSLEVTKRLADALETTVDELIK